MPLYEGEATRGAWEARLLEEVCSYTRLLVETVGPRKQVLLAVDGVVPMAKLRQQRLRRFKSHWVSQEEVRCGKPFSERWDTNAITPGTVFMEKLSVRLKELCGVEKSRSGVAWILSDTSEPGEGEHKVMAGIRAVPETSKSTHVVYGLDADLIVLSMLMAQTTGAPLWLFREAMEFGEIQDGEFRFMSVDGLKSILFRKVDEERKAEYIVNYCLGMTLLGNDFLPHSLTFHLKNGGHELLFELLNALEEEGLQMVHLLKDSSYAWSTAGLYRAFQWLSGDRETQLLESAIQKKLVFGSANIFLKQGVEHPPWAHDLEKWMRQPAKWFVEAGLVKSVVGQARDIRVVASECWRETYSRNFLGSSEKVDLDRICAEYLRGLVWVSDYYLGKPVDPHWMFPWLVPPSFEDLATYTKGLLTSTVWLVSSGNPKGNQFLAQQEHLSLVLPKESWWLVRDKKLRKLPELAPQMWPSTFELCSAGKHMMWECEAKLPLLTPMRLRNLLHPTS